MNKCFSKNPCSKLFKNLFIQLLLFSFATFLNTNSSTVCAQDEAINGNGNERWEELIPSNGGDPEELSLGDKQREPGFDPEIDPIPSPSDAEEILWPMGIPSGVGKKLVNDGYASWGIPLDKNFKPVFVFKPPKDENDIKTNPGGYCPINIPEIPGFEMGKPEPELVALGTSGTITIFFLLLIRNALAIATGCFMISPMNSVPNNLDCSVDENNENHIHCFKDGQKYRIECFNDGKIEACFLYKDIG